MAGHSRPKDGVASLAYSRPKDGVASLAYVPGHLAWKGSASLIGVTGTSPVTTGSERLLLLRVSGQAVRIAEQPA